MAGSEGFGELPRFERRFFRAPHSLTRLGEGELGGKAAGLVRAQAILARIPASVPRIAIRVPRMVVLATDLFDAFVERNRLADVAGESDDRVAHAFRGAELPVEILGDLRSIVEETRQPLAVRSSSLLEDRLELPFAGIYGTKMTPNVQPAADARFGRLTEAIKFVYASTFFREARDYARAAGSAGGEKMAVIVQEVVGRGHGERFYPEVSGVARTLNFYPTGSSTPEEGVVSLALGLGKTIVAGGACWSYSPRRPASPPPYASASDLVRNSQSRFWAVNMGRPPAFDPMAETEYLVEAGLDDADYDDTLRFVASTYDPASDRLRPGTADRGPRALDFAPLLRLELLPLNDAVLALLAASSEELGGPVEIEFALTLDPGPPPRGEIGFLQVRPMSSAHERVDLAAEELRAPGVVVASTRVMGNGEDRIADAVYVPRERFRREDTRAIAAELAALDRALVAAGRTYVLLGFGRWGSADPWLGVPVEWSAISGARAIVESTLPGLDVEPSQGSHFFHNLSGLGVRYFMVHHTEVPGVAWDWLDALPAAAETAHLRHVVLDPPLRVRVDGRTARGVIRR